MFPIGFPKGLRNLGCEESETHCQVSASRWCWLRGCHQGPRSPPLDRRTVWSRGPSGRPTPTVAQPRAHSELAHCLPPAAGAGTGRPQPRPPLPGLTRLQAKSGSQSSETRMHGALRDHPLVTWPLLQCWERPHGASAASGVPAVNPSLLVSPAFLPPPSSSAFPCRSLVSSPRPGPGHAPVHFHLLLRPPRFLQDEAEEGGSSQAAGNSGVSRTGGHSLAPATG